MREREGEEAGAAGDLDREMIQKERATRVAADAKGRGSLYRE